MTILSPFITEEEAVVDCSEPEALKIMNENGLALRNPRNRRWLTDQKKRGCPLKRLSNRKLVRQIEEDELYGISHEFGIKLSRIYRVLNSQAFDNAIASYSV